MGHGRISGTITEKGTGLPFSNVVVNVERTTRSGENGKTYPTIIASTVTDEDGNYELPFSMKLRYLYRVYCMPVENPNGDGYSEIGSEDLDNKKAKVDFTLSPFAYVEVHLHKESNTVTSFAAINFDFEKSKTLNIPNYPFDAVQGVYQVRANETVSISWSQFHDGWGGYEARTDYVTIRKGDTLSYTINLK